MPTVKECLHQFVFLYLVYVVRLRLLRVETKSSDPTGLKPRITSGQQGLPGTARKRAGIDRDRAGIARDGAGIDRDGAGYTRDGAGIARDRAGYARDKSNTL